MTKSIISWIRLVLVLLLVPTLMSAHNVIDRYDLKDFDWVESATIPNMLL